MTEEKEMTITVELRGKEVDIFDAAFTVSGFRTKSEYMRHLIRRDLDLLNAQKD
jgi:hypothetical protein